jgi:hypothetical protein
MTLNDITILANNVTDENYSSQIIIGFVNQAIARINATLDSNLPVFTSFDVDYTALNDNWIRLLFVTYASYGIKANDGSLNEADRLRQEFEVNFRLLEENRFKAIPVAYQGEQFGGVYRMDTSLGINVGWFVKRNNGDTF